MAVRKLGVLIFFVVSWFNVVSAQQPAVDKALPDTLHERIIYEYDTVFVAPDTVKLTDTLISYISDKKELTVPEGKTKRRGFRLNINRILGFNEFGYVPKNLWINVSVSPFVTEKYKFSNALYSISTSRTINFSASASLFYLYKKYVNGFSVDFCPFREQLAFMDNINTVTKASPYDSVLVSRNCTYTNVYNYLNLQYSNGYRWEKGNFSISCVWFFATGILLNYSAIVPDGNEKNTVVEKKAVRKINFAIGFSPSINYNLGNKAKLFISPYYSRSVFNSKTILYPYSFNHQLGVSFGILYHL